MYSESDHSFLSENRSWLLSLSLPEKPGMEKREERSLFREEDKLHKSYHSSPLESSFLNVRPYVFLKGVKSD